MDKKKKIIIITCAIVAVLAVALIIIFAFKGKQITISFDSDGAKKVASIKIKKGETIKLPTVEKEGFVFTGWYDGTTKVSASTKYDKDTLLKAKWISEDAKTFTITFDSDGGSKVDDLIVECDKELTLPANPTKDGYNFVSWIDKNETPILDKALLTCENITLRAKWEKEETTTTKKSETTKKAETTTSTEGKVTRQKSYKCPTGYTLNGTKCISDSESVHTTESCKTGYSYSTERGLCYKTTPYEYKCGTDEVKINGYCYSSPVYYSNDIQGHCELEHYHYVNGTCYKNQTNLVKYCPKGYVDRPAGWAGSSQSEAACIDSIATIRTCPSGYTQDGNSCYKTINATYE